MCENSYEGNLRRRLVCEHKKKDEEDGKIVCHFNLQAKEDVEEFAFNCTNHVEWANAITQSCSISMMN